MKKQSAKPFAKKYLSFPKKAILPERTFLVIVESPSKIKKIEEYLGNEYQVIASCGHICTLSNKCVHYHYCLSIVCLLFKYKNSGGSSCITVCKWLTILSILHSAEVREKKRSQKNEVQEK